MIMSHLHNSVCRSFVLQYIRALNSESISSPIIFTIKPFSYPSYTYNMPDYNLVSLSPPVMVKFLLPEGGYQNFEVLYDEALEKEFVQCDICNKAVTLKTGRSLSILSIHRNTRTCTKAAASRQRNQAMLDEQARTRSALMLRCGKDEREQHQIFQISLVIVNPRRRRNNRCRLQDDNLSISTVVSSTVAD